MVKIREAGASTRAMTDLYQRINDFLYPAALDGKDRSLDQAIILLGEARRGLGCFKADRDAAWRVAQAAGDGHSTMKAKLEEARGELDALQARMEERGAGVETMQNEMKVLARNLGLAEEARDQATNALVSVALSAGLSPNPANLFYAGNNQIKARVEGLLRERDELSAEVARLAGELEKALNPRRPPPAARIDLGQSNVMADTGQAISFVAPGDWEQTIWRVRARPANSNAMLYISHDSRTAELTPDLPGSYVVEGMHDVTTTRSAKPQLTSTLQAGRVDDAAKLLAQGTTAFMNELRSLFGLRAEDGCRAILEAASAVARDRSELQEKGAKLADLCQRLRNALANMDVWASDVKNTIAGLRSQLADAVELYRHQQDARIGELRAFEDAQGVLPFRFTPRTPTPLDRFVEMRDAAVEFYTLLGGIPGTTSRDLNPTS